MSPKLTIQPSSRLGGGYGGFVAEAVDQGELLFEIPRSAQITLDRALFSNDSNVYNNDKCRSTYRQLMDRAGPGAGTVVLAGDIARERLLALHDIELAARSSLNPTAADKYHSRGNSSFNVAAEASAIYPSSSWCAPYLATLPWKRGRRVRSTFCSGLTMRWSATWLGRCATRKPLHCAGKCL